MGIRQPTRLGAEHRTAYEVSIHETCAQLFRNDWTTFNRERKQFATLEEVIAYINKRYSGKKRVKMYRDTVGGTVHVGYIYSLRSEDISHAPVEQWNQQDWVEVREVITTPIVL